MIFIDIVIVILFIMGFLEGWKKGLLTSLVNFASSILIFILALLLKGPLSLILIENLPFLSFNGIFRGITSINVVLYEGIAFLLALLILGIIFKLLLKLTGILNKFINATIILGLPNKLGGALINVLRYYILGFAILFILSLIPFSSAYIKETKLGDAIVNKTPILSVATKDLNNSLTEIYDLVTKIDSETKTDEVNRETLTILLKYDIISRETADSLHKSGKLEIADYENFINTYENIKKEGENND